MVREVEVTVFSYATEDESKVKQAVKNVLSIDNPSFETNQLTGHYSDPMIIISTKVKKKEASGILIKIFKRLNSLDRKKLLDELDSHLDQSGKLYMRLDKQKAYHGRMILQDVDPIRLKLKFQIPHKSDLVAFIREYLLNMEENQVE